MVDCDYSVVVLKPIRKVSGGDSHSHIRWRGKSLFLAAPRPLRGALRPNLAAWVEEGQAKRRAELVRRVVQAKGVAAELCQRAGRFTPLRKWAKSRQRAAYR